MKNENLVWIGFFLIFSSIGLGFLLVLVNHMLVNIPFWLHCAISLSLLIIGFILVCYSEKDSFSAGYF